MDLDAFFAAVEQLEDPTLRRKALIVGGDPKGRGVVATANYVARNFGIHSAMSCAEALRRCPDAVFVRPRHALYRHYSQAVWSSVREVVPTVEQTGIDEGYLDLGEIASDFLAARKLAEAVQSAVRGSTALTCSLGVATCKVVAKVASDRRKPGGLTVVRPGKEASFLAPFDVRLLPGVGPRAEDRLRAAGVATIGELAGIDDPALRRLLPGKVGAILRDRARGIDGRGLETQVERISISTEETFERDVADRDQLHAELQAHGWAACRPSDAKGTGGPHRDDQGALPGLLDPQPLLHARRRPRRRRRHRRRRLHPARSSPGGPARPAASRRRRSLEHRGLSPARAELVG